MEILEALLEPLAEVILEALLLALVAVFSELIVDGLWEREHKLQTLFGMKRGGTPGSFWFGE
jgi:hypothetical protein